MNDLTFHSWYCPAMGMYRMADEPIPQHYAKSEHFQWIPLFAFKGNPPEGWVLRAYYSADEKAWYASHRTMSDKTATSNTLVSLCASVMARETARHVGPQKIKNRLSKVEKA
jgi:hypothetical protein